jgi:hypothetical protein
MEIDVGKAPEPHRLSPTSDPGSIPTLDGWIENLMNCKQLAESDVSRLCDRVSLLRPRNPAQNVADHSAPRLEKCYKRSPTCNRW